MTEKNKKTLIGGMCVAILLIVAGGYAKFMFLDNKITYMNKDVKKEEAKIDKLKSELDELIALENRRDEIQRIKAKVEEQAKRLPAQHEIDLLILSLRRMLMMTTVSVVSAKKMNQITRNVYGEIPFQMSCRSAFHSFGQFLNMIEVNPDRLMRIKEFDIKANAPKDILEGKANPFIHDIDLTLAAYVTLK